MLKKSYHRLFLRRGGGGSLQIVLQEIPGSHYTEGLRFPALIYFVCLHTTRIQSLSLFFSLFSLFLTPLGQNLWISPVNLSKVNLSFLPLDTHLPLTHFPLPFLPFLPFHHLPLNSYPSAVFYSLTSMHPSLIFSFTLHIMKGSALIERSPKEVVYIHEVFFEF